MIIFIVGCYINNFPKKPQIMRDKNIFNGYLVIAFQNQFGVRVKIL